MRIDHYLQQVGVGETAAGPFLRNSSWFSSIQAMQQTAAATDWGVVCRVTAVP
jgi:hypothetical protein